MVERKIFNIRVPKEVWKFLKLQAFEQEKSMNAVIVECFERYKKYYEKKQRMLNNSDNTHES